MKLQAPNPKLQRIFKRQAQKVWSPRFSVFWDWIKLKLELRTIALALGGGHKEVAEILRKAGGRGMRSMSKCEWRIPNPQSPITSHPRVAGIRVHSRSPVARGRHSW